MRFAVDIDQTICGANAGEIYAHFHAHDLGLSITPETLTSLTCYRDFLVLPQVVAFRRAHEKVWNASRHRALATSSVLEAFTPIDGAVEGVRSLSSYGEVNYYTARPATARDATQQWLERYGFVSSQQVVCCGSIAHKVAALSSCGVRDERIILIDDRGHTQMLTALEAMREQVPDLVKRLTLVAFHVTPSQLPTTTLCPLLALPCWNELPTVLGALQHPQP